MSEHGFGSGDRTRNRKTEHNAEDKIQYFWDGEEQLLRLISSRAPVAIVLNGICIALDCQVGNVVSLITPSGVPASELSTIAMNAELFGLFTFCSERIVAENDELLGTLEMYSTNRRSPSADESQFIERAKCLAAIAIKIDQGASRQGIAGLVAERPKQAHVLEWPVSFN
jgi:hypothetical protein